MRNKEQLLQLVFERVTEEAKLTEPDPSRWQEQLRASAHRMREVLNNHRDVARLSVRLWEQLAGLLRADIEAGRLAGRPGRVVPRFSSRPGGSARRWEWGRFGRSKYGSS